MGDPGLDEPSLGLDSYIRLHYNLEVRWDPLKSAHLKRTRGLSFEEAFQGQFVAFRDHPRRRNQHVLLVVIDDYIWTIPCVENQRELFLKTLFPDRRYTRRWRRGELR